MKLYFSPSACSLAPHIVAQELGLPLDLVKVDLASKRLPDGSDFCAINPKGYVPVLESANGQRVSEVPAVLQCLAEQAEATSLLPAPGDPRRYEVLSWLAFINSEIHKPYGPLFTPGASAAEKDAARASLRKRLAYVDQVLSAQDYLTGASLCLADPYLYVAVHWSQWVQFDLTPWPALAAFMARMAARPAVQAAMRTEASFS
ncbi:glutathione binding-like protein [Massilia sp. TS11]|uniref:glutathione binding-like protein n=1 Tax=Massilia sp. TS11 TaxID=2908003 RepID=UPI001EDB45D2|nr:glutathione binding-like protein [Massilia sp. TS11]MCG2583495.1 glutathione binding-like protein [Massilia sp. TS11]